MLLWQTWLAILGGTGKL